MSRDCLDIVVVGLSVTSSWGNGHATTYRALLRALAERGHRVLFLERDVPWYANARDLPKPEFCMTGLYGSLEELRDKYTDAVRRADWVIHGSFVPDGRAVADWVLANARGGTAFYDIDTPVTLTKLESDTCPYIARAQIPRFDIVFSFTGGPTLRRLEDRFGAQQAVALYCSFDGGQYFPEAHQPEWDLGYMGTYSADRQPYLDELLLSTARARQTGRFVVAGALYPADIDWPANVERIEHLPPQRHRAFYCKQRFTLNLTRADMKVAGYSPSVRLFEAAACGVPILSDDWPGLSEFFSPEHEIIVVRSSADVGRALASLSPEAARRLGENARQRVLASHTAHHRATTFESNAAKIWRPRLPQTRRPPHSAKPPRSRVANQT